MYGIVLGLMGDGGEYTRGNVINDEGKNTLKENLGTDALWHRLNDRIGILDPWKTGAKKQEQQMAEDDKAVEPPAQSGAVSASGADFLLSLRARRRFGR